MSECKTVWQREKGTSIDLAEAAEAGVAKGEGDKKDRTREFIDRMPSPKASSGYLTPVRSFEELAEMRPDDLEGAPSVGRRKREKRDREKRDLRFGWLVELFELFDGALERRPIVSQILSVAVLACLSDLIAQLLEGLSDTSIDGTRMLRFVGFRAGVATPFYLWWLSVMERGVSDRVRTTGAPTFTAPLLKAALDLGLYIPLYQAFFFLALAFAEGQPLIVGWQRVVRSLPKTLPFAWLFWGPVQVLNFWLVPPRWRVLTVNIASVAWNVAMSLFNEMSREPLVEAAAASLADGGRVSALTATPTGPSTAVAAVTAAATAASELARGASAATIRRSDSGAAALHIATDQGVLVEQPPLGGMGAGGVSDAANSDDTDGDHGAVAGGRSSDASADGTSLLPHSSDDDDTVGPQCTDMWPHRWCRRRAAKCWSEWVLVRCPSTCGLCDQDHEALRTI